MRWQLLAIGRLKSGPERDLVDRYCTRVDSLGRASGFGALDISEIPEARARSAPERALAEGAMLQSRAGGTKLVAFDERAPSLSSPDFAERLRTWRDAGSSISFVIGGPDGLDAALRIRADLVVSFGQLTLPHQIVRVLVVEQIYRALTILAGHPYHRGEPGES